MEYWDLYDRNRIKTGRTHRRGDPMPAGYYRMVIHVCIFNARGQMLIQQRQPFKAGWPDKWDVTVGGSAVAGEDSRQAAERETLEEIGLALDLSDARPKLTINFEDGFDDIYLIEREVNLSTLRLQEEEVQAVRWAYRGDPFHDRQRRIYPIRQEFYRAALRDAQAGWHRSGCVKHLGRDE